MLIEIIRSRLIMFFSHFSLQSPLIPKYSQYLTPTHRVHNGVLPQIGSPGESLFALGTNKGFREAVQVSQVLLQHWSLVAAEQTEYAVVRLVGVVLGLFVFVTVLLELESQITELAQVEGLLVVR